MENHKYFWNKLLLLCAVAWEEHTVWDSCVICVCVTVSSVIGWGWQWAWRVYLCLLQCRLLLAEDGSGCGVCMCVCYSAVCYWLRMAVGVAQHLSLPWQQDSNTSSIDSFVMLNSFHLPNFHLGGSLTVLNDHPLVNSALSLVWTGHCYVETVRLDNVATLLLLLLLRHEIHSSPLFHCPQYLGQLGTTDL